MGQGGAEALWITLPSHRQKQNSSIYEIQQDCRSVDFPPPHHPPPQQQPAERKQEKAQNPGLCTVASGGLQKLMGPVGAQKVFKVSLIRSSQPDPTREFFFLTRGQPCKNQARKNNQIRRPDSFRACRPRGWFTLLILFALPLSGHPTSSRDTLPALLPPAATTSIRAAFIRGHARSSSYIRRESTRKERAQSSLLAKKK